MQVGLAPDAPGVYYLLTPTRRLSYVGTASNLRRRLAAQAREADVIIALRPARNRAIKHDQYFSFVTIARRGLGLGADGEHGCFPHLGCGAYAQPGRHCIDGFEALDRIVRDTKPDRELVHAFLAGAHDDLPRVELDIDQPHTRHGGTGLLSRVQFVAWIKAEVEELLR